MINTQEIKSASHILLITENDSFANTSALYSYILTLHKKVSIYQRGEIAKKFSFLAWSEKCRIKAPSSAEFSIVVENSSFKLYEFFKEHEIKINKKMATALYAGLLQEYDLFKSKKCNGTIFALASELILLGAEYQKCYKYLVASVPLAHFRLKSVLYKNMQLIDDAKVALIKISDAELQATGTTIEDVYEIIKEVLEMINVEEVRVLKKDENNKILKIIKDS